MFKRRARKGQAFHHPYFGCREFPVTYQLIEKDSETPSPSEELKGEKDLGFHLTRHRIRPGQGFEESQKHYPHFFVRL